MVPKKNLKNNDRNRIKTYNMNNTHAMKNMMKANDAARQMRSASNSNIKSDILGSYTGMSYDGDEPEQDADDL